MSYLMVNNNCRPLEGEGLFFIPTVAGLREVYLSQGNLRLWAIHMQYGFREYMGIAPVLRNPTYGERTYGERTYDSRLAERSFQLAMKHWMQFCILESAK